MDTELNGAVDQLRKALDLTKISEAFSWLIQ
jgi:hypothetical protein